MTYSGICSCGGLRTIPGGTNASGRTDQFCLRCGKNADDDDRERGKKSPRDDWRDKAYKWPSVK